MPRARNAIASGTESNPREPRSRTLRALSGFPVVLGFLAGIAVCAIGLIALTALRNQPQAAHLPSPRPAADAICSAVERQDYGALYDMLASGQRSAGTEAQFAASQRQLDVAVGRAASCTASIPLVDGAEASVTFSVTRTGGGAMTGSGHLVYEGSGWRLDTYDAHVV